MKIVTKIVVGDRLRPNPMYLRDLDRAIRAFVATRASGREASILGRIEWVTRLDQDYGEVYLNRFREAIVRKEHSRRSLQD